MSTEAVSRYAERSLNHLRHLSQVIGPRGSCTSGERAAADYVLGQLRQMGVDQTDRQDFRGAPSAYHRYAVAFCAGLAGAGIAFAARTPAAAWFGALLHGLGAWGMLRESDFAANWTRWIVPGRPSQNVIGRISPKERCARRVMLTAHVDTHRTPFFNTSRRWQRAFQILFRSLWASLLAGMLLFLLFALTRNVGFLRLALLPELLLLSGAVLFLHPDQTPFSPGAYDNASGVGSALGLAERLLAEPLKHTEVWPVFLGCEENGSEGSAAFLSQYARQGQETFLLNLDMMGCGKLYVRTEEGFLIRRRPPEPMLAMARRVAAALPELGVYERVSQAFSDATFGYKMRLKALSLGTGPRSPASPIYRHTLSDTVEHIEPAALLDTHRYVWALLETIDQEGEHG